MALTSIGYDVELVARRLRGVIIDNTTSIQIKGDFGDKTHLVPIVRQANEFTCKKDIIFLCIKSYDAIDVMPIVKDFLNEDGVVVTIQNSYWIDSLKKLISPAKSVCMYLDISFVTKDNITYVRDTGGATLGIYDREAFDGMNKVKSILEEICEIKETNDLYGFLIGRNILNTAISSLGAISGLKLGDILNDRNGRYLFVKIITESVSLFDSLGLKILPYNDDLDYYTFVKRGFVGFIYRLKLMRVLRINNKDIKSSALIEIERGRKTEISVPMSSLIRLAGAHEVSMPYITAIRDMIVEIEDGKRRVDEDAFYDKKLLNIKEL